MTAPDKQAQPAVARPEDELTDPQLDALAEALRLALGEVTFAMGWFWRLRMAQRLMAHGVRVVDAAGGREPPEYVCPICHTPIPEGRVKRGKDIVSCPNADCQRFDSWHEGEPGRAGEGASGNNCAEQPTAGSDPNDGSTPKGSDRPCPASPRAAAPECSVRKAAERLLAVYVEQRMAAAIGTREALESISESDWHEAVEALEASLVGRCPVAGTEPQKEEG